MRCLFYKQNLKVEGFKCHFQQFQNDGDEIQPYLDCPCVKECAKRTDIPCRYRVQKNTVINTFGGGRVEIIKYNEMFDVPELVCNIEGVAHARKFIEMDGILHPLNDSTRIADLQKSIFKGSKRAQDNFYGYALCNDWKYFFTLTTSSAFVNRYDDEQVKELWHLFKQCLIRFDKKVKVLCSPERHNDNALHFHGLMGSERELPIIDYGSRDMTGFSTFNKQGRYNLVPLTRERYYLFPYYENGQLQYSSSGAQLYCLNFYTFGRNTMAILPEEDTNIAAVNYLITYTTKQGNLGYNKKRYYRTHNLNFKDKAIAAFDNEQVQGLANDYKLKLYKTNERFTVYRNFNIREEEEEESDE